MLISLNIGSANTEAQPCWTRSSLRSKRFRGAKSEERGFWRFARARSGVRAKKKKKKDGVGEGREGTRSGI